VRGKVVKSPGGLTVYVRDLVGDCHGGRAAGFAEIRLSDPVQYGVNLSVEGVDLTELLNAGIEDPAERIDTAGKLAGTVQLVAVADKPETRRASGVLQVTDAKIYKMPVVLGLMHVVLLTLPGDSAFNEGTMTYHMEGNKLIFDEIYLTGQGTSIVGSGTLDVSKQTIHFTFLAGPGALPRIGYLDEFVETAMRELVEIEITGTLNDPQTRTIPLRALDDVLRRMLRPGEASE